MSHLRDEGPPATPDGGNGIAHEDLVALALGALSPGEERAVRDAVGRAPGAPAALAAVERHLALHDRVPTITPSPELWRRIEARLESPAPAAPRSLLRRFWMPIAAAALLAAALLFQGRGLSDPVRLHGDVARLADGAYGCRTVSRMALGDGVVVTMDADTIVELPTNERLALRTGRVHLSVERNRRGFAVESGDTRVTTTGTVFWVAREGHGTRVGVAEGTVHVERGGIGVAVPARHVYAGGRVVDADGNEVPAWMTRPTIEANLLDPTTVAVVIRNDMPDSIQLAPPQGGEPFFFGHLGGAGEVPLALKPVEVPPHASDPLTLAPGAEITMRLRLPRALRDDEPLALDYPAYGIRVEAAR